MAPTISSPSSSTTTTTSFSSSSNPNNPPNPNNNITSSTSSSEPMQSWWESISKSRSTILSLSSLLSNPSLSSLSDSDRPSHSLLHSPTAYSSLSSSLSHPSSGSGSDPLCQWLYETFQSSDPDLRLIVLSFLPLLTHHYLSRVVSSTSSLAGFEAVLLSIYASQVKSRGGKPISIHIPDLSHPSLYHSPKPKKNKTDVTTSSVCVGRIVAPPLEPQVAVKSTKRAVIVAVALDCYYKKISLMPARSKIDLCRFVRTWAGQDCNCRFEFDDVNNFEDGASGCNSSRVPFPWEIMQPVLRILGHCLLAVGNDGEVRDMASAAVRCLYARASHDLVPQAILAAKSLIQLDKGARKAAVGREEVVGGLASNPSTPCKPKKPEMLLVSK